MQLLVLFLAFAGFAAVALRTGRALLRLAFGGVEVMATRELANTHARRGDLTGQADALELLAAARRARARLLASLTLYIAMLLLPLITPWPAVIYVCYCALWLLPHYRTGAP